MYKNWDGVCREKGSAGGERKVVWAWFQFRFNILNLAVLLQCRFLCLALSCGGHGKKKGSGMSDLWEWLNEIYPCPLLHCRKGCKLWVSVLSSPLYRVLFVCHCRALSPQANVSLKTEKPRHCKTTHVRLFGRNLKHFCIRKCKVLVLHMIRSESPCESEFD